MITAPMEGVSSATVMVLVGAGSRYEGKEKIGLSHFLEHMIFKGTKKRPSSLEINSMVDSVGGENNAFTAKDQTGFYIKVDSRHLELAFDILSDTLSDSLYLEDEINRERGTIMEEINMYEDTPLYKIEDVFYQLLFDGNPLCWSIAGEKKTVKSIKREDFLAYVKRFYQGSDMVLAVAGKVTEEQVQKLAEKYFSCFNKGEREPIIKFKNGQTEPKVRLVSKKTDQAHLCFGFPAFAFGDQDEQPLEVLSAILGEGMSSRLFIQVRERRGLAYYIHSITDFYNETGLILCQAGVNLEKIDEAIKVIREQFEKTKNGDVSAKELTKAKEFLKGRSALRMENSRAVAEWYADKELLEGKIKTPDEISKEIDQVTLEDISRVADRVFKPEKINLAIIGPFKDKERFLELIK